MASWTRATILEVLGSTIRVQYIGTGLVKQVGLHSSNILPLGTFSNDWDWRENLKVNDEIDFLDNRSWYHSTIIATSQNHKMVKYALRIFRENGKTVDKGTGKNYFGWSDTFDVEVTPHHPRIRK